MTVKRILSAEVARITGLAQRTILSLSARGAIPGAAKLGRRWTYDREKIVAWIAGSEAAIAQRSVAKPVPSYRPPLAGFRASSVDAFEAAIKAKLAAARVGKPRR